MINRTYTIYIIKNKLNDKVYIGQTCQTPEERFRQHLKPSTNKKRGNYKLYNAMNKYGKDNFYFEVLETNISKEEIDKKEIYYISLYDSYNNGYNSTPGGDGRVIVKIEDVDLLLKLFNEGKTYKEMADIFNMNKATIQRTLHSLGFRRNNVVDKQYLLENKDIKTNIEMANELGVSDETISRAFKKFKIKRGKGCSNKHNPQNQPKNNKSN